MVNISTNINKTKNDIGRFVDHHCLEVVVRFVDIGWFVDHHCLEVVFNFVDIGGNVDLKTKESLNSDGQQFHQYQQN
jgi:hypothetical protein